MRCILTLSVVAMLFAKDLYTDTPRRVAPVFIETEMSAKALNNDTIRKQKVISLTPMGKLSFACRWW